jgi:cytochrome c-type biogenesis protein CcmF
LFLEAVTGDKAGVGGPFYNRFAIPISYVLLIALAVGSVAPWRAASPTILWERTRTPLVVALGAGALAVAMGYREGYLLLGVITGVFVIAAVIRNLAVNVRRRADKTGATPVAATTQILRGDRHYWAGQISHLGVAILAIGIALSSNLAVTGEFALEQFETVSFAGMELTYFEPAVRQETNREVLGARIGVARDGRQVGVLEPSINDYFMQGQVIGTPSVASSLGGDLYLTLDRFNDDGITVKAFWFPYIWMVWAGGLLAGIGPLWAWVARRRKSRDADRVPEKARS